MYTTAPTRHRALVPLRRPSTVPGPSGRLGEWGKWEGVGMSEEGCNGVRMREGSEKRRGKVSGDEWKREGLSGSERA